MDAQRTSFVLTIAALFAGPALAAPPSDTGAVRQRLVERRHNHRADNHGVSEQPIRVSAGDDAARKLRSTTSTPQRRNPTARPAYPAQPSTNPFATSNRPLLPQARLHAATSRRRRGQPIPAARPRLRRRRIGARRLLSHRSTAACWRIHLRPQRPAIGAASVPRSRPRRCCCRNCRRPPIALLRSTRRLVRQRSVDSPPNSYRGSQPSFGSSVNSTPQSSATSDYPDRPRRATTGQAAGTEAPTNNSASIGSSSNNSSRPATTREPDFPNSQRVATNPQDTRSTPASDRFLDRR